MLGEHHMNVTSYTGDTLRVTYLTLTCNFVVYVSYGEKCVQFGIAKPTE